MKSIGNIEEHIQANINAHVRNININLMMHKILSVNDSDSLVYDIYYNVQTNLIDEIYN